MRVESDSYQLNPAAAMWLVLNAGLLHISGDKSLASQSNQFSVDVNHAAAIQFGRMTEVHWRYLGRMKGIDEADKEFIRENIMQAIYNQV